MPNIDHYIPASVTPYYYEHTAQTDVSSPMPVVIASGSFVAQRAAVEVNIAVTAAIHESIGGWASLNLYVAAQGVTPLTPKHQSDALTTGVIKKQIGAIAAVQGSANAAPLITGLTPGTTYNWEIAVSIVGGAGVVNPTAFTPAPFTLDFQRGQVAARYPELAAWGGLHFADGSFSVIKADHIKTYTDTIVATFTAAQMSQVATGNRSGWVAATPDGTRLVVTHQGDNAVAVVTTGAGSNGATAPAVQGSYATGAAPTGVRCAPDNATAWVCCAAAGAGIQKLTLATGVVGTAIVPNALYQMWDVAVAPANDFIYTVSGAAAGGRVQKIRVSDNAIISDVALSNPTQPGQCFIDITADGAFLYIVAGAQKRVWKVRTSDMTEQATVASARTPTGVAVFSDGQSLLVSSNDVAAGNAQIIHLRADDLSIYTQWGNQLTGSFGNQQTGSDNAASDVALGPRGAIYVPNNTKKFLNNWFGGWMQLHCGNASDIGFYNDKLTVRVAGAV